MEFLYEYGIFLAKIVTGIAAFVVLIAVAKSGSDKIKDKKGTLLINNLSENHRKQQSKIEESFLTEEEKKQLKKDKKSKSEERLTYKISGLKVFILSFNGGTEANEVEALRREIDGILSVAKPADKVLMKIESGGGTVVGYGLAASQMQRIKDAGIQLDVVVDKIAASGGYMMACLADKLYSAPFAVLGSIGVVAEFPNYHKLLEKIGVNFEQFTAGEYKRTVTPFSENDEKSKAKFKEDLEETHTLFKDHVMKNRPDMDIDKIATGEHWYGQKALELKLVDAISTSDTLIQKLHAQNDEIFEVVYKKKTRYSERFMDSASSILISRFTKFMVNYKYKV
jgi:serine protease SohB